jgi:hypothetical protein
MTADVLAINPAQWLLRIRATIIYRLIAQSRLVNLLYLAEAA